jgi:hypothetical protein
MLTIPIVRDVVEAGVDAVEPLWRPVRKIVLQPMRSVGYSL